MRHLTLALLCAAMTAAVHAQTAPTDLTGTPPTGTPPSGTAPTDTGPGSAPGTTTTTGATLDASSLTISLAYPDVTLPLATATVTVDSAVEVACAQGSTLNLCASANPYGDGLLNGEYIDVSGTTISARLLAPFNAASGDSFNGLVFSGLSFGSGYTLTGFTLTTNIAGLDSSDITFTGDSLAINLLGIDPSNTTDTSHIGTFQLSLQVTSAVPEPGSMALLALGLLGMGSVVRRQRAVA